MAFPSPLSWQLHFQLLPGHQPTLALYHIIAGEDNHIVSFKTAHVQAARDN